MKLKDLEKYVNDSILDSIYKEREDFIFELNNEEKMEIAKIKERYPIDYEQLITCINNIPPHFKNIRENILKSLDIFSMRENLLSAYNNEKFYKIGFCDGIRTIIENLSK